MEVLPFTRPDERGTMQGPPAITLSLRAVGFTAGAAGSHFKMDFGRVSLILPSGTFQGGQRSRRGREGGCPPSGGPGSCCTQDIPRSPRAGAPLKGGFSGEERHSINEA
jgi:hypothetical protein